MRKIAQAEKNDWHKAVRAYLMAYRTPPHNVIGATPSELVFNRRIRTQFPDVQLTVNDGELRDRDMATKEKSTTNATNIHGKAVKSSLKVDGKVLLTQQKQYKLTKVINMSLIL